MRSTTCFSIGFCFALVTTGFSQQDSCSHQKSFAQSYAPHDASIETWRLRSLWSGILLPAVGPLGVGVCAANVKVDIPINDTSSEAGHCFSTAYSHQVKSERIKEVAKSGALGTGLGAVLYFFIIVFAVGLSFGGGWGNVFGGG
jgi:hypothetical protein